MADHGADERRAAGKVEAPRRRSYLARWLGRSLEVGAYWLPVVVPLVLLGQFGTRGLRPARIESRRLAANGEMLERRRDALLERRDELNMRLEAYHDPIYLERLRRLEATGGPGAPSRPGPRLGGQGQHGAQEPPKEQGEDHNHRGR